MEIEQQQKAKTSPKKKIENISFFMLFISIFTYYYQCLVKILSLYLRLLFDINQANSRRDTCELYIRASFEGVSTKRQFLLHYIPPDSRGDNSVTRNTITGNRDPIATHNAPRQ